MTGYSGLSTIQPHFFRVDEVPARFLEFFLKNNAPQYGLMFGTGCRNHRLVNQTFPTCIASMGIYHGLFGSG